MKTQHCFIVLSLLLFGCTGPGDEWTPPRDHPAHPEAAEAPFVVPRDLFADPPPALSDGDRHPAHPLHQEGGQP